MSFRARLACNSPVHHGWTCQRRWEEKSANRNHKQTSTNKPLDLSGRRVWTTGLQYVLDIYCMLCFSVNPYGQPKDIRIAPSASLRRSPIKVESTRTTYPDFWKWLLLPVRTKEGSRTLASQVHQWTWSLMPDRLRRPRNTLEVLLALYSILTPHCSLMANSSGSVAFSWSSRFIASSPFPMRLIVAPTKHTTGIQRKICPRDAQEYIRINYRCSLVFYDW